MEDSIQEERGAYATLTSPRAGDGGATEVLPEVEEETETALPWNVLLHNDPVNLISYVIHVLRQTFGFSKSKAEQITMVVHDKGRAVVWSGEKETAEFYVEQLHASQLMASLEQSES